MRTATLVCLMLLSAIAQAKVQSETRKLTDFTGIKAGGAFEIFLMQGNTTSLKLEANQKMLNKIRTEVKDGILNIYTDGRTEINSPVKIFVTIKELKKVDMGGAARLKGESVFTSGKLVLNTSGAARIELNVKTDELDITAAGAGSIEVEGSASKLRANLSGASSLRAFGLEASSVSVEASGASCAQVNAGKEITAEASGASSINYKGEPGTKNINRSGSSSVRKES
jgi:carbon monoxide dehydrogenase subunit G